MLMYALVVVNLAFANVIVDVPFWRCMFANNKGL